MTLIPGKFAEGSNVLARRTARRCRQKLGSSTWAFWLHDKPRHRFSEFHLTASAWGRQETALEAWCPIRRQFAPDIGVDQVRFHCFDLGQITRVGKRAVLDADLFLFAQLPEQVTDQQSFLFAQFGSLAIMPNSPHL